MKTIVLLFTVCLMNCFAFGQNIVSKPSIIVMGIECRTMNTSEAAPKDIPQLWNKFFSENIINKITNRVSDDVIALYCDYEGDYTQPYSLVIGCEVESYDSIPEGMVVKIIPSGSYAVYQAIGEHPKTLIDTWTKIWQQKDLPRTYTGDFEVYSNKFLNDPKEVEIFIAIENK